MDTPFDNVITSLWQYRTNNIPRNTQPSELFSSVSAFSRLARVLYLNMAEASEKLRQQHEALMNQPDLAMEEIHETLDFPINCRLSYMQFIEEVNRIGRVLRLSGHTPPLYSRIYFFRNNFVEHRDRYLQFLSKAVGFGYSPGKIVIPYDFAGMNVPSESQRLQQELTEAFARSSVVLPSLVDKWDREYSDIIYTALEEIDSELRYQRHNNRPGIPEPIVILLCRYSFPMPICDMDEYCTELAAWLGAIPLR